MGLTGPETTQSYESQLEKVKEITGVEVPKYYSPNAINPLRYAEQIKKRQMLWSKKPVNNDEQPAAAPVVEPAAPLPLSVPAASSFSMESAGSGSFNKWEATN